MIVRGAIATCIALVGAVLLVATCRDDGRTTTREARKLIADDYPFLFSPQGYQATHHWHEVDASLQLLVRSGDIVFVRRPDAKPVAAEKLRTTLLRASRRANFQLADKYDWINERPPPGERKWIDKGDAVTILDVARQMRTKSDPVPPKFVCRIWIAPDASRYVASYSMTD